MMMGGGTLVAFALLFSMLAQPPIPVAMLGKPAPHVSLDLLDGGRLDLAEHEGEVVVLDFWATWCAPCRITMPTVDRVANDYTDKDVQLYFVNQAEEPELVREFAAAMALSAPIALDTEQTLGWAFKVEGLPFTAIIGRDGIVRSVRVGATPQLEEELRGDIEAALALPN